MNRIKRFFKKLKAKIKSVFHRGDSYGDNPDKMGQDLVDQIRKLDLDIDPEQEFFTIEQRSKIFNALLIQGVNEVLKSVMDPYLPEESFSSTVELPSNQI